MKDCCKACGQYLPEHKLCRLKVIADTESHVCEDDCCPNFVGKREYPWRVMDKVKEVEG